MRKRLDAARSEVEYAMKGEHDVVIVNDDLAKAGGKLESIALGSEGWEQVGDSLPEFDLKDLD